MEAAEHTSSEQRHAALETGSAEYWINQAINAKHAIEATARGLADVVNAHGNYQEIGLHEALLLCADGLGTALLQAMERVSPTAPSANTH